MSASLPWCRVLLDSGHFVCIFASFGLCLPSFHCSCSVDPNTGIFHRLVHRRQKFYYEYFVFVWCDLPWLEPSILLNFFVIQFCYAFGGSVDENGKLVNLKTDTSWSGGSFNSASTNYSTSSNNVNQFIEDRYEQKQNFGLHCVGGEKTPR